jgi:hypothetical protein
MNIVSSNSAVRLEDAAILAAPFARSRLAIGGNQVEHRLLADALGTPAAVFSRGASRSPWCEARWRLN